MYKETVLQDQDDLTVEEERLKKEMESRSEIDNSKCRN